MRTQDYRDMLLALCPPGQALASAPGSTWRRLLEALAQELARVDARSGRLQAESDPRQALELLEDWERALDLPDACNPAGSTLQERRMAVTQRLTVEGGQSPAYYRDLAARLGYEIALDEYRPFVAGLSRCGDVLCGGHDVRHSWRVTVHGPRVTYFRAGESATGERLLSISAAEDLTCILRRLAPAHTTVVIAYEEV
ncbi:YmfQ family protein [Desulfocurvibacter africanus]|uniref:Tail protein n=1 Tax=Desulfocurvibacter africanus subsp. africanus str. Walvis Bay TaxID=690850 RepID=F3Z2U3_DESAF|nr:putative phage tail protein [Desulfocurvibacter africanus]EGJ50260.1 Protein of unknown function DUF2313 [Desulfocurvibacter africanus subsp. africanus str. Walvis Bay]